MKVTLEFDDYDQVKSICAIRGYDLWQSAFYVFKACEEMLAEEAEDIDEKLVKVLLDFKEMTRNAQMIYLGTDLQM